MAVCKWSLSNESYIPFLMIPIFILILFLTSSTPPTLNRIEKDNENITEYVLHKKKRWEQNIETFNINNESLQWIANKYYESMVTNNSHYIFEIIDDIPKQLSNVVIYALTASDPFDTPVSEEINKRENEKLFKDLSKINNPKPMKIEGFGFRVWFNATNWNKYIDQEMVDLCRKYLQAGLYKWYMTSNGTMIHQVITCFEDWKLAASSNPVTVFVRHKA